MICLLRVKYRLEKNKLKSFHTILIQLSCYVYFRIQILLLYNCLICGVFFPLDSWFFQCISCGNSDLEDYFNYWNEAFSSFWVHWWVELVRRFWFCHLHGFHLGLLLDMEGILDSILSHFCILLVSSVWDGMSLYIGLSKGLENNKNRTLEHPFWKFKLLKLYWGIHLTKKNS